MERSFTLNKPNPTNEKTLSLVVYIDIGYTQLPRDDGSVSTFSARVHGIKEFLHATGDTEDDVRTIIERRTTRHLSKLVTDDPDNFPSGKQGFKRFNIFKDDQEGQILGEYYDHIEVTVCRIYNEEKYGGLIRKV